MPNFQAKYWYPPSMIQRLTRNINNQAWLLDQGSLTQKLRQRFPGLRVEILDEGFNKIHYDEAQTLNIQPASQAWVRQVQLVSENTPLIFARTVIPNFSIQNPWWRIKHLGQQPLGEVLFNQAGLQRSNFELCRAAWFQPTPKLFARRCQFAQAHSPLLLTEVFLQPLS
jgi:chorismate lyase